VTPSLRNVALQVHEDTPQYVHLLHKEHSSQEHILGVALESAGHQDAWLGGDQRAPHQTRILEQVVEPATSASSNESHSTESRAMSQSSDQKSKLLAVILAPTATVFVGLLGLLVFFKGLPCWQRLFPPDRRVRSHNRGLVYLCCV
jgi:hypothetical protein